MTTHQIKPPPAAGEGSMSEIPKDIMKAAYDCARGIYLNVDDAGAPYLTTDDIEEIAKAILAERERHAGLLADLYSSVVALVDAMVRYELDVDSDATVPASHRDMMAAARAAIAKAEGGAS
jgi:hypothetical protein